LLFAARSPAFRTLRIRSTILRWRRGSDFSVGFIEDAPANSLEISVMAAGEAGDQPTRKNGAGRRFLGGSYGEKGCRVGSQLRNAVSIEYPGVLLALVTEPWIKATPVSSLETWRGVLRGELSGENRKPTRDKQSVLKSAFLRDLLKLRTQRARSPVMIAYLGDTVIAEAFACSAVVEPTDPTV
jgi:hypothetical protein